MKKSLFLLVIFAIILSVNFCYADGPSKKLQRGLSNMIMCPAEIGNAYTKTEEEYGFVPAVTLGVVKGVFQMAGRFLVGVYETVTFPAPVPEGYKPILEDPEVFKK